MSEITKNMLDDFFNVKPKIDYRKKLNDEQYKAVMTTEGPVLIIAGAGSGKTTVLTYRLAYLIEKGVAPEKILLLTFTNKAADEMISRALNMLGTDCKINGSTFHAFCARLLFQYHEAANLGKDFLIKDANESADILNYVKELKGVSKEKEFPNGSQLAAMFSMSVNKQMPLEDVVKAMYGGRFKSYLEEIEMMQEAYKEYKEERDFLDYDDLLIRTNKMLRENDILRRRISDTYDYIMVDEYQDSNILQFELISLLRSFDNKNICVVGDDQQCVVSGMHVPTDKGLIPIDVVDMKDKVAVASGLGSVKYVQPSEVTRKKYEGYVYEIKTRWGRNLTVTGDHTLFIDDREDIIFEENNADFYLFGGPAQEDGSYLHRMNVGNDALREKLNLATEMPECESAYEETERILAMDEFKNVAKRQFAMVAKGRAFKFAPASSAKTGMILPVYKEETKTIVGDIITSVEKKPYSGYVYDINVDDYMNFIVQGICVHNCIYGFRGANHKNILNFPKQFAPCSTVILFRNYRSNQEILDFTNKVALEAKERFDKELLGTHSSGHKPDLYYVGNETMQAQAVFFDIVKRHQAGTPLSEMAVLIRASRDSNFLEALLAKYGATYHIPYKKFGGQKFLEKAHIRDVLSFLKVLVNERDEISWFRIFQLYPNIGPVYGRRLVNGINANGIDFLLDKQHQKRKYGEFLPEIYNWYYSLQKLELQDQIEQIVTVHYKSARDNTLNVRKSKESIIKDEQNQLDEQIEEAIALVEMSRSYKNASEFLNDIPLDANMTAEDDSDYLTISTVHSAKGLEFDTVYVLSCIEGSFPWAGDEEEAEEERRVFYVATTRAKENLLLFVPAYIIKYGRTERTVLSRFLDTTRYFCKETIID